ncbi:MAG: NADH-quinone oxidoreductase subunit J [Cyclobacteriaceae bacterium]
MSLTPETLIFYAFAGLTLLSALMILFTRNVLYAAFSLILTFLGVAALYVFAGADFIAVTQIIVYVGGVLVLMIFGVMLTNKISGKAVVTEGQNHLWAGLISLSFFVLLLLAILQVNFAALGWIQEAKSQPVLTSSTVKPLGILLMSDFVLPFEAVAILLLLALIGAAFIAKRQLD